MGRYFMVNVILLWSSTYEIVKIIKLFKKLPRKILGDCFIVIIFYFYNYYYRWVWSYNFSFCLRLKVCIPKGKRDKALEKPMQYGTVAGWGSTKPIRLGESPGPLSAELRQVTVPIIPDKECKQATIYSYNKEDTLCAGFKRKPKDPCFGDIGSPLVMQNPRSGRWNVIGLFGWSEGCGKPRKYAYYTRVSRYRKWIRSIVKGGQWISGQKLATQ